MIGTDDGNNYYMKGAWIRAVTLVLVGIKHQQIWWVAARLISTSVMPIVVVNEYKPVMAVGEWCDGNITAFAFYHQLQPVGLASAVTGPFLVGALSL